MNPELRKKMKNRFTLRLGAESVCPAGMTLEEGQVLWQAEARRLAQFS